MVLEASFESCLIGFSAPHVKVRFQSQGPIRGFFYPPHYGFLPREIKSRESFEVPWAWVLQHEFEHEEERHQCLLGTYGAALEDLSDALMSYAFQKFMKNSPEHAQRWARKAGELQRKLNFLERNSIITSEMYPTFKSVNEALRDSLVDSLVREILPRHFKKRFDVQAVHEIVCDLSDHALDRMDTIHSHAYQVARGIFGGGGRAKAVQEIAVVCRDVYLGPIDVIGLPLDTFQKIVESDSDRFLPDTRLQRLLKRPEKATEMLEKSLASHEKVIEECLRLGKSECLPEEVRIWYEKAVKSNLEEREKRGTGGLLVLEGPVGDMFLSVPYQMPESQLLSFAQRSMSMTCGNEYLFNAQGVQRLGQEVLRAMEAFLSDLKDRVENPNYFHEGVSEMIKAFGYGDSSG